jgi:hypothetical protein
MTLETVPALEEVIGSPAVDWALVEPGGIVDIIDAASEVLGISEG